MSELYEDKPAINKTEAENAKLWHERIRIAKADQETWAHDSGANRFIREYKGEFDIVFHGRNRKFKVPPINDIFSYVQSDIASSYNRDPYITVVPEAGSVKGAALWEVIINYYWRALKIKEEIEYEIIDKDLVGYSFHKTGYSTESIGTGENLKIENEILYSSYVNWRDVLWNVGSKRPPTDCAWMAQRIVKPLSEIKKKFPAAKFMDGTPSPDVDKDSYKKSTYKDDIKVGTMWEVWDMSNKKIILLAETLEDRYLAPIKDWPEHIKDFPFRMYFDYLVPESSRPMSAIAPWEPQVLEEMILLSSAINHSKRWNRQAFVKNGTIDDNSLDKYERGDDGAVIVYNGDSADIKFADFGQLPTDFYLLMDRLQAIKRNISGQPEFTRGGVTKTGTRTVGELQMMERGATGLQERKKDRLETHLENIARDIMANLKANLDIASVIKITGDTPGNIIEALGENYDPITGKVSFTEDEIKGEYDVDIKSGSTLPLNKENRLRIYETVMQTVAQLTAQGPISPFMNALIKGLLEDYDIKGLEEAYSLELEMAQRAKEEQAGQQSIEDQKTAAEAMKRQAQARNIAVETEIASQEAELGAINRAKVERFTKSKPVVNGVPSK